MSLQRSRPEWSFAKRIEGNTASGAWSEDRAQYGFLLAANVAQKFLRSFSRILGSEALVQNKHRNGRINLLQRLACGFAMYGFMRAGITTSFAFVAFSRIKASSMVAVVKALYPALHSTSRRNVRTSVES